MKGYTSPPRLAVLSIDRPSFVERLGPSREHFQTDWLPWLKGDFEFGPYLTMHKANHNFDERLGLWKNVFSVQESSCPASAATPEISRAPMSGNQDTVNPSHFFCCGFSMHWFGGREGPGSSCLSDRRR